MHDIFKAFNIKKSTGLDNIPAKFIVMCADLLKIPLEKIINLNLINLTFPGIMQIARIFPSYKNPKDGSRLDKTCYRPVSILTVCFKGF